MTIRINKYVRLGGVLTDLTTFTLGVTRNDTGAVVVASGTALTHDSTGVYSYEITEPAAGLEYTITFTSAYGGTTESWTEVISGDADESIPMPDLTGDNLVDTLNSLIVERLRVARDGGRVSYTVAGQTVRWNEYLAGLDRRIEALRREIAQTSPFEDVGVGF